MKKQLHVANSLPVSGSFSYRSIQIFSVLFSFVFFLSSCEKNIIIPIPQSDLPVVIEMDPSHNEAEVLVTKSITATFSSDINPAQYLVSFNLMKDMTEVPGTLIIDGNKAIFTPETEMEPGSEYVIEISIVGNIAGARSEERHFNSAFTTHP